MTGSNAKKRAYHHGNLAEALVKAGLDILTEGDLSKFTLRECARRAGVSHAAPKNHFASLDELKSEIAARGFEQMVRELAAGADAAPSQSPDDRLIAMGNAYVRFATGNSAAYLMMFRDGSSFDRTARYREAGEAAWSQLEAGVAAVVGPGRADVEECAAHAFALVHGFASLIIEGGLPPGVEIDSAIAASLASLPRALRGLGSA